VFSVRFLFDAPESHLSDWIEGDGSDFSFELWGGTIVTGGFAGRQDPDDFLYRFIFGILLFSCLYFEGIVFTLAALCFFRI